VEITESAVQEFKKMISESNAGQNAGIRFFVSGGGCCASYGLDIVENGEPGDKLIEKGEFKVFIQPEAYEGLSAAIIDFTESWDNAGFVIKGLPSCCDCQ
jgi:iron-sulfur cluster assembly protein